MEKISLFKELKKGGYESCVITTFNVYFPFYEEVLLRRMRSCGVQQNSVLIDAGMCQAAMDDAYPLMAGRHYTLAPMNCKAAFHPKIVLLLGKKKGLLAVGSHNLTFSGYGFNAEVSNVIRYKNDSDKDTVALFWQAWIAIQTWLDDYGQNLSVSARQSIDTSIIGVDWLKPIDPDEESDTQLFFSSTSTAPLWEQVEPFVPANPRSCSVVGAFFDNKLRFLDRFIDDVVPDNCIVGIQANTVHAPNHLLTRKDMNVVDNDVMVKNSIKADKEKKARHQYFHAKAIYVDDKQFPVLISGSANPSAPAWLASGSQKNAEAVLLREGKAIKEAVKDLGFKSLAQAASVENITTDRVDSKKNQNTKAIALIQASYQRGRLNFQWNVEHGQEIVLLAHQGIELNKLPLTKSKSSHDIDIGINSAVELVSAEIHCKNSVVAKILIQFVDEIDAITAKGSKKKFREALGTLDTDSPELKQLFNCLDKIIFSEKDNSSLATTTKTKGKDKSDIENNGASLVVDWAGVSSAIKTKSKRLKVSDDLTSLLDAFVYGLGYDKVETEAFSGEDKFGRNEEEQIGKDDEEVEIENDNQKNDGLSGKEKLELCHRRIKKIVNRLCVGLDLLKKRKKSHIDLLPALLAVISLLKELNQRSCKFDWVKEEYTILPEEAIYKLFSKVCECWWGSRYGLLSDKDGDSAVLNEVDELVRLRALLVWLAWYTDLSYRTKAPFGEGVKERDNRLWCNAVYVLLAQALAQDEMVEDEATKVCAGESEDCLRWFNELVRFGNTLHSKYHDSMEKITLLEKPEEEGWIFHRNEAFKGLRYGLNAERGKVRFACVSEVGAFKVFGADKLVALG